MISFPKAFFVTGTGTDVGKTVVSGILLSGLPASYWKPIQCGFPTDTAYLKNATQLPYSHFLQEEFIFEQPVSPHLAAKLSGETIELSRFRLPESESTHLIIEGAGGILVPINDRSLMIDLVEHLKLPVLIVALSTLGTINHTLLTLQALRQRNLQILGVVLNGPSNVPNQEAIEHYGQVPVIAQCEPLPEISAASLRNAFSASFAPVAEVLR